MEWKIVSIGEGTDIDENGKFIRFKRVRFTVNGMNQTLRISMSDFNRDKTNELVKAEAEKLVAAYGKK
ncbi:MAG: hypothetical protein KAJ10_05240 [Thermodesulfovibrionia bacterium]|nr:hypothetical protein [Thermodesulfovibrionia bacterium]